MFAQQCLFWIKLDKSFSISSTITHLLLKLDSEKPHIWRSGIYGLCPYCRGQQMLDPAPRLKWFAKIAVWARGYSKVNTMWQMLNRLMEQQKAICWHNKIRKAAAVLNSSHKNLIVSLKLRTSSTERSKRVCWTYAMCQLDAEGRRENRPSMMEMEKWTWWGELISSTGEHAAFPLTPNPLFPSSSGNQSPLFQTTLVIQNK